MKVDIEWKLPNGKYKCPQCGKEYTKKGISSHIWRSHGDGINHTLKTGMISGRIPWNKGLNVDNSEGLRSMQRTLKEGYKSGKYTPSFFGKKHTPESIELLKKNAGGYRKGSGRGKGGWYKGYWCDSTYELCWLIYQLDNGKIPIRNKKGYIYTYEDKEFKYYPDFIVDDVIYEIKGYETDKDLVKYKSIKDKKLTILNKDNLKDIFEYINSNYSKDYITLYDYTKYENYYETTKVLCDCG